MPVGAGPGVEQHADHGKVDHGAGAGRRVQLRQPCIQLGLAIHSAGLEMAPTAVVGDLQVGIAGTRDVRDFGRGLLQRVVVDAEPARVARTRALQQLLRALAHGGRGAQRRGCALGPAGVQVGTGAHEAHPSNPRPLAFFNSSASGTVPGVK